MKRKFKQQAYKYITENIFTYYPPEEKMVEMINGIIDKSTPYMRNINNVGEYFNVRQNAYGKYSFKVIYEGDITCVLLFDKDHTYAQCGVSIKNDKDAYHKSIGRTIALIRALFSPIILTVDDVINNIYIENTSINSKFDVISRLFSKSNQMYNTTFDVKNGNIKISMAGNIDLKTIDKCLNYYYIFDALMYKMTTNNDSGYPYSEIIEYNRFIDDNVKRIFKNPFAKGFFC